MCIFTNNNYHDSFCVCYTWLMYTLRLRKPLLRAGEEMPVSWLKQRYHHMHVILFYLFNSCFISSITRSCLNSCTYIIVWKSLCNLFISSIFLGFCGILRPLRVNITWLRLINVNRFAVLSLIPLHFRIYV